MKIELPKEIARDEAGKLFHMLFGTVPKFTLAEKTLTIENPTEQMELDVGMIVDVLKREMGLPMVDEEELRREALIARIAKVTDDTGVTLVAEDVREALRAVVEVWIANDAKGREGRETRRARKGERAKDES